MVGRGKHLLQQTRHRAAAGERRPRLATGAVSGKGEKFPAKYQHALFACDWTYGALYAVHLTPEGAGYSAKLEEFATGK